MFCLSPQHRPEGTITMNANLITDTPEYRAWAARKVAKATETPAERVARRSARREQSRAAWLRDWEASAAWS